MVDILDIYRGVALKHESLIFYVPCLLIPISINLWYPQFPRTDLEVLNAFKPLCTLIWMIEAMVSMGLRLEAEPTVPKIPLGS